jgi:hypothetical protein
MGPLHQSSLASSSATLNESAVDHLYDHFNGRAPEGMRVEGMSIVLPDGRESELQAGRHWTPTPLAAPLLRPDSRDPRSEAGYRRGLNRGRRNRSPRGGRTQDGARAPERRRPFFSARPALPRCRDRPASRRPSRADSARASLAHPVNPARPSERQPAPFNQRTRRGCGEHAFGVRYWHGRGLAGTPTSPCPQPHGVVVTR